MSGRSQLSRTLRVLAVAILVVVFGWSGLNKIIDPSGFSLSVFRYHLLPYEAVNIAALWIAGLELACVAGLFILRLRTAALWTLLCLLIVFTLGIGINLLRGSHMACGCFSTSPMAHPMGWLGVLKNVGLMALVAYVLTGKISGRSSGALEHWSSCGSSVAGA